MLSILHRTDRHWNVPLPRSRDVDEINVAALAEVFEIVIAAEEKCWWLLTGFLYDAAGVQAFIFDHVADCGYLHAVDTKKLVEHTGGAGADADYPDSNHRMGFELHSDDALVWSRSYKIADDR